MTPMEAWSVIHGNLLNLYLKNRGNCFKGYTEADTEAETIAFRALREMEKREKPEPLETLDLHRFINKPIWVEYADLNDELRYGWFILRNISKTGAVLIGTEGSLQLWMSNFGVKWKAFEYQRIFVGGKEKENAAD